MTKKYSKKKDTSKKPDALGPKYRTPDFFSPRTRFGEAGKGSKFSGGKPPTQKFNPAQFKVQHKG